MSITTYSSLSPTGDVVTYDNSTVDYPAYNVVDTFGTVWVSKVHGYEMNVLEIASAGKIAFTPSNEHSLDVLLDNAQGEIKIQARNQNDLVLDNEGSTGSFAIKDNGDAVLSAVGGASTLRMDANGNYYEAGGSGSNLFVVPSARSHCFDVGATEVMCIEEGGVSISNLTVNGTDFRVPVGPQTSRPSGTEGQVFYNETANRFEGYASGAWSGLGGTIDVDQDTYVSAETSPNADNDQLLFVTSNVERMRIDSDGKLGYGTTSPSFTLDWKGDAEITTDDGNIVRVDASGVLLHAASGSNYFVAQAGQDHVFDVGSEEIARIEDSGVSVSNLTVNGTNLTVPRGPEASRPPGINGQVFYNEDTGRFEGFASEAWGGLGGVVDVDQDTYISAETVPGADNDQLLFYTACNERMRITEGGMLGYGTSNPEFTIDVVGDLRVSGSIIAANTSIGEGGTTMELGVKTDGSTDVIDGAANDGAGITIAGVPEPTLFTSEYKGRFEKSLRWNYSENGLSKLGQKDTWDQESFWRLKGGHFRLSHTNPDSGAEIEYIMRVNENDEFQLVRHLIPVDGGEETYDVVAKFGNNRLQERLAAERGYATMDADKTNMDTDAATVDAFVESFSAYDEYRVYGALYPITANPTVAEVVSDAGSNGYTSSSLPSAQDNTTQHTFATMHDGSAIPNSIVKFAAVTEVVSDGALSTSPHISFVLNDASAFDELVELSSSQTTVSYQISFGDLLWDDLSAADKAIFEQWMEDQVLEGVQAKGIEVNSIDLGFSNGSILVDIAMTFNTVDTTKVFSNITDAAEPLKLLKDPTATPVEFVDRPKHTVKKSSATTTVTTVKRIRTKPEVVSVTESSSTASTMTFAYEVVENNPDYAVDRLYALVSPKPLKKPVLPSKIVSDPAVQSFVVSATSGLATVNMDTASRAFVYFVATNNETDPVLSSPFRFVSEPFSIIMPSSAKYSESTGGYQIASIDNTSVSVGDGMTTFTDATSGEAHLMVFEEGDGQIPSSAAQAKARIDAGATKSSGKLKARK